MNRTPYVAPSVRVDGTLAGLTLASEAGPSSDVSISVPNVADIGTAGARLLPKLKTPAIKVGKITVGSGSLS